MAVEKYWCDNCKAFCNDIREDCRGEYYYGWDEKAQRYEYEDASDTSGTDMFECGECGEPVELREFKTNKWEGEPRDEQRRKNLLVPGM
jgi:transcription initiation factor IIE alpha subunit